MTVIKERLFAICLLCFLAVQAFGQSTFLKYIDAAGQGVDIAQTVTGGFVIGGATSNNGMLMRIDSAGRVIWRKQYGGNGVDFFDSVFQAPDRNTVAAGTTYSFPKSDIKGLIVKVHPTGVPVWTRTISGPGNESILRGDELSDGNYLFAGNTNSTGAGDALVLSVDSSGKMRWAKAIGTSQASESAMSLTATLDGGALLAGSAKGAFFLSRLDSAGKSIWLKAYRVRDSSNVPMIRSLQEIPSGGFILGGDCFAGTTTQLFLMKISASGSMIWAKTFQWKSGEGARTIEPTPDGGFVLAGSGVENAGLYGFFLRVDAAGKILWQKAFPASMQSEDHEALSIVPHSDGGFVATAWSGVLSYQGMLLMKLNADGELGNCMEMTAAGFHGKMISVEETKVPLSVRAANVKLETPPVNVATLPGRISNLCH